MQNNIATFRDHVIEKANDPSFIHHQWFVKWHLEIVNKVARDLLAHHPEADADLVELMVWLHDYAKILNFDDEYGQAQYATARQKLKEIGFDPAFADKAVDYIETLDKKLEIDLHEAPIEIQIVSSADGCSHMVGPFMVVFWHEATDKTFAGKTYEELMDLNRKKLNKDWDHKIVLPEAREAFLAHHNVMLQMTGELPAKFL
jgi:hypothetical protein